MRGNKQKVQFFLAYLLALLVDWPCFRFMVDLAVSLTIGLAIIEIESIDGEVIVGFLGWFWFNKLISFLRCYTAKTYSQMFSFLG